MQINDAETSILSLEKLELSSSHELAEEAWLGGGVGGRDRHQERRGDEPMGRGPSAISSSSRRAHSLARRRLKESWRCCEEWLCPWSRQLFFLPFQGSDGCFCHALTRISLCAPHPYALYVHCTTIAVTPCLALLRPGAARIGICRSRAAYLPLTYHQLAILLTGHTILYPPRRPSTRRGTRSAALA